MIDIKQPVFTLDGVPVQVVSDQGRHVADDGATFSYLAYVGDSTQITAYDLYGQPRKDDGPTLTNDAPPVPLVIDRFVNVYKSGKLRSYDTANDANLNAKSGRKALVHLVGTPGGGWTAAEVVA